MSLARSNHTTNTVLGAGEIYIDIHDDDGRTGKERYLGDSVGATLSVTSERTTIQSGDGAVAQDLVDFVRSVSRTFGFTLRDSSVANWALFLIGKEADGIAERTSDGSEVADETFGQVKKGETVQLGATAGNPMGVGRVKSKPTAKNGDDAIVATDIETSTDDIGASSKLLVDLASGRVTALADIADLKVTYTPAGAAKGEADYQPATGRAQATTEAAQITCSIRYLEDDPAAGKGRNVYISKCNLAPGGEAALKSRDTEQQMAFTATVQDPGGGNPAIVVDGEEA